MQLYAAGFNAWDQLYFDKVKVADPDDLFSFTRVLDRDSINSVSSFLSYTAVETSAGLSLAGTVPKEHRALRSAHANFAETSNGQVVVYDDAGSFRQYPSVKELLSRGEKNIFAGFPDAIQVVAYETGFAALTSQGHVWTWGDERYQPCLGREVTEDSPADRPGLVSLLEDLPTGPISKIAAGGYVLAALTSGRDLYYWGCYPGRPAMLNDVSADPTPAEVEDKDIVDVGVGDLHMIVLTADGQVFVIGDNGNGQIGLGREVTGATSWTRVEMPLAEHEVVTGVAAGPRSSFILVRERD